MKISGSIYSDKKRTLKETVLDLKAHQVDLLHVDCNDDISVFEDIGKIRTWCGLPIDLHIITETPEKFFDYLRKHPVEYVTFQYEELLTPLTIPADIKGEKGLGIITPTAITAFDEYPNFDFILMMATIPGQSGGVFDPDNFRKIRQFKQKYPNKNVHVDGGVNGEVSFILRNMGVHSSVSGSFLFKGPSIGQALMDLTKRKIESRFKIKDFMIPQEECPIIDFQSATFKTVIKLIDSGKLGFIVVEESGHFMGIISNADLRKGLIKHIDNMDELTIKEIVNQTPITIDSEANVDDMLHLVREQSFPVMYLPVINAQNKAVGIITFVNLIKGEL